MNRLAILAAAGLAVSPIDVSSLVASRPALVCELDLAVLRGDVRRLSWSPDGGSIHVQTLERETLHDFIVTLPEGILSVAFGEPEWAALYWAMKSDLAAPDQSGLKIEVLENHQRTRPTPFTGGFANNGAQTVDQRNPVDTYGIDVRLNLLGEEVGYFVNVAAMAGVTYGWGPAGSAALVFVDAKGRVTLFDRARHKQIVPDSKDATMPAWSPDGARVAFLQKDGRRKFRLMVSAVRRTS